MAAPKGNQFWKIRSKHGRNKIFSTPDILWEQACNYFEWCEKNPIMAAETVKFQGVATLTEVPKMRAMTIGGLCIYLDNISPQTWKDYKERKDFIEVTTRIENVIKTQKFEGAAAELLNPNIIARDLGLSDKQKIDVNDLSRQTDDELDDKIRALIKETNAD